MLKHFLKRLTSAQYNLSLAEKSAINSGLLLARQTSLLPSIPELSAAEFSVFSQFGEDGIISWLTTLLPSIPHTFIEVGVQNYLESNTRFLLLSKHWSGTIIDASSKFINSIRSSDIYWRESLTAVNSFVTTANINELCSNSLSNKQLGLLSIDIDGNDYWIWDALTSVQPFIVVVEFNSLFGDNYPLVVPYDPSFDRTSAHYSNLYFGASLPAFIDLAAKKGYQCIGTCSTGVNAFFIRNDIFPIINRNLDEIVFYPSLRRESRSPDGLLTYLDNQQSRQLVDDLPLLQLHELDHIHSTLSRIPDLYSARWSSLLGS